MSASTQPPAKASETFAALGRALALAVRFESACRKAAQVAGIAQPIMDHGPSVLADPTFFQTLVEKLGKPHLDGNLRKVLALPGMAELGPRLQAGRLARNRLVHELCARYDPFVTTPWHCVEFEEELADLVLDMAGAQAAIAGFLWAVANQPAPPPERSATYPIRLFRWVMEGGEAPSLL